MDGAGRALDVDLDDSVWLVHPAELPAGVLAAWRSLQRARAPAIPQLDRGLPVDQPTLASVCARLEPFPSSNELTERGFFERDPRSPGLHERVYRYRHTDYTIGVDVDRRRLRADTRPPAVVLHELARDLSAGCTRS